MFMEMSKSSRWNHATAIMSVALLIVIFSNSASAQSVKVGRTVGGSGFHIPSYVALDKGLFKAEGLDANFIAATAGVLVRATIAKEIEFTPIPGDGSETMPKRAPMASLARESLTSQWTSPATHAH